MTETLMRKRFKLPILIISMFVFLCMGGCGKEEKNLQFTDFKHIEEEFLETVNALNWPEGTVLPTSLEGETADQFQIGYGDTRACLLWECAWEKEWLDSYMEDTKRADAALKELEKAPSMNYMSPERCDDATRSYFSSNLEKARLGDPSGFEENIRANGWN